MKKKLQVFISSTFTDMLEERQSVVEAILRAGHIPAGMELFAAGDESQLETIRRWIDDSDVFMLILGGRYGSMEPNSGKSYIELEYDYAVSTGKPFFAAVISDEYLDLKIKSHGKSVIETAQGALFDAFRVKVTSKICRFFKDPTELKLIVFESLSNHQRNEDLAGWVRGSDAVDPKATLEEINRLQTENGSLRKKVEELSALLTAAPSRKSVELSDDSVELLTAAASTDGNIMYMSYGGGASVSAGNRNFITSYSPREEARWKAAIEELLNYGLIEDMGYKREIFQVTKSGYDAADQIKARRENVSE